MRTILSALALALAACSSQGTVLSIEALGEPGAVVSYGDQSVTLDASGRGSLSVAPLSVRVTSGLGTSGGDSMETQLVDADGRAVELRIIDGRGHALFLPPICFPPTTTDEPIEQATLLLRRLRAGSTCRLVNPSVVQNGHVLYGQYTPGDFDDAPCGPFALP
jgi:hypothetical protein